jgi:hypothetical protein
LFFLLPYFPAAQNLQSEAPTPLHFPTAQGSQGWKPGVTATATDLPLLFFLGLFGLFSATHAPILLSHLPALHGLQVLDDRAPSSSR